MLSGDFWDRRFCRISTIPANALSGGLIGAVKLHSRLYLLASITLSKTGTFFPSVTLSVIIHCSSLTIGGPGLHWAIKQVIFPPTASHFNAFQNTTGAHAQARARTTSPLLWFTARRPPGPRGRSLARHEGYAFRANSWSFWGLAQHLEHQGGAGALRGLRFCPGRGGEDGDEAAFAERLAGVERGCGWRPRNTHFEHGVGTLLLRQSLNDSRGRGWRSGEV